MGIAEMVRIWVFPAGLLLGTMALLLVEWRTLQQERREKRPRWTRFGRRFVGSLVIAAVAIMLHLGKTVPAVATDQHEVMHHFYYWMVVLGLVAISMGLAVWDVVDSLRSLRSHLETLTQDELISLREQLRTQANHKSQPM